MRIDRLELIRYGKFTAQPVVLPRAEHDFHVIVGPNEAGKSTIRAAIFDLLYGFPKSSAHAFLHLMPDLRLGATIEHDGKTLEFHRTKGNKATLRTSTDEPLPENALAPLLGATDRKFFEQMFGLDHQRLVEGGGSILSASNDDVGRILFESAAGIASMGNIRASLESEADKLWGRRKSGERVYYQAEQAFERAKQDLKSATLRAKDWAEAHAAAQDLANQLEQAQATLVSLRKRQNLLERVRRVGPLLVTFDSYNAELARCTTFPELPETAARTLADAEIALAAAQTELTRQEKLKANAEAALAELTFDSRLLELAHDIQALDEHRVQYRAYPTDIKQRQAEVDEKWRQARTLAEQLGWLVADEESLRARMPASTLRGTLGRLIRQHASVLQAKTAADAAHLAKKAELKQARDTLDKLPRTKTPPGLRAAIEQAKRLGDVDTLMRELKDDVQQREEDVRAAYAALGRKAKEAQALRAILVPPGGTIQSLLEQERDDRAEARRVKEQQDRLVEQIEGLHADIERFRKARHPVQREDVLASREARDATWASIKAEPPTLIERSGHYERLVEVADALADERHATAEDAAELQTKQDRLADLERDRDAQKRRLDDLEDQVRLREQQWAGLRAEHGLPEMSIHAIGDWLAGREHALVASDALETAAGKLQRLGSAVEEKAAQLSLELAAVGAQQAGERLDVLLIQADEWVQAADQAAGQRLGLESQIAKADDDLENLRSTADEADSKYQEWERKWSAALDEVRLQGLHDPDAVETVLDTLRRIDEALTAMQQVRAERIEAMHADLRGFEEMASELAGRLAPELATVAAAEVSIELKHRLESARETSAEAKRQQNALNAALETIAKAHRDEQSVRDSLAPLFEGSGTHSVEALRLAVSKSDERRDWQSKANAAKTSLLAQGDGLTIEGLRSECQGLELAHVPIELEGLSAEVGDLFAQANRLSAKHQTATATLTAMAGAADAAKAEAERQGALAEMADALERYVKVYLAARLLAWSIEQYRAAKQGPMLTAASGIFTKLTLGSFEKLVVDFDTNPPTLQARRHGGELVGVAGLSDGTRDQLYLALRLAALEMHFGQAHVMPFIADDLFINFDDQRARAGLEALAKLSKRTQILFLTHHDHLLPVVQDVFGSEVNVVKLAS